MSLTNRQIQQPVLDEKHYIQILETVEQSADALAALTQMAERLGETELGMAASELYGKVLGLAAQAESRKWAAQAARTVVQ